jgi:uncharacterized protein (TIGR00288 family)
VKTEEENQVADRPLAFLVDGDNMGPGLIEEMLAEATKYGHVAIRRVYGNWTSQQMTQWKRAVQEYGLNPIQQFPAVSGKGATDAALIIDAMDILHSGKVKGFCIVSSDSDFTRLALRIRESGAFVMGIGAERTPAALRRAYHVFVLEENIEKEEEPGREGAARITVMKPAKGVHAKGERRARRHPEDAAPLLKKGFEVAAGDDKVAVLSRIGEVVRGIEPSFDPRTYGKKSLSDLLEALPKEFELVWPERAGRGQVRVKRR